ncbi:hypothetical protein BGZ51_005711 [Haplosporangium sp. Z 767]|nr:hypothetical protein BGZ50_007096 [Haplosporangium sp. Z 11]KAF9181035.1 hypothetical protein BGZ51_005711 [Haplosporangium sp. Z 767]
MKSHSTHESHKKRKHKNRNQRTEIPIENGAVSDEASPPVENDEQGQCLPKAIRRTTEVHVSVSVEEEDSKGNTTTSTTEINAMEISEAAEGSDNEETPTEKRRKVEPSNDTKVRQMSKSERRKLKKENKSFKKMSEGDGGKPSFMLLSDHQTLSLKDIRNLVIYLLTSGEIPTLPWIMVKNKFNIQKVVLLYIAGLDPQLFNINPQEKGSRKPIQWVTRATSGPVTEFQQLKKIFNVVSVVKAGGDKQRIHSPPDTLLHVPLSNSEKNRRQEESRKKNVGAASHQPEKFMLTLAELREHEFPLPTCLDPSSPLPDGWIETEQKENSQTSVPKKMIAMDCEMCRTTAGSELTRISLINEEGETIYDELVMPENPIVDYLTQYSGMTPERLAGVTTTLADIQRKLKELVTYDTILVGHSLENDMKVLKFAHPFIIDTTVIYHHTRGPPFRPSLKWVAQKWLNRKIQTGGEKGHDSVEDALTCMDLTKLKIKKGPGFGEYNQDQESIFSKLSRYNSPRSSAVVDMDWHYAASSTAEVFKAANDDEVVQAIPKALEKHSLVWCRLRNLEINHGKNPPVGTNANEVIESAQTPRISSADKIQASEEEIREAVRSIDNSIAQIVESLPANTALLVTSGHGDYREVSRLQARQKHFQHLYNTLTLSAIPKEDQFLDADQKALEEAVDRAKDGVCFFMVK